MSLDQETIEQQRALLAAHRRALAALLQAPAETAHAPPGVLNGIAEARAEIRRIKAYLREHGVHIDDAPNDEAPPQGEPLRRAGANVPGQQTHITTGGGDYIEGNVHQEGVIVRGGTIHGNVIGQ